MKRDGRDVSMNQWARELIDSMQGIAEVLDRGDPTKPYSAALAVQAAKISEVELTPSARMLRELETTGESFFELALRMSRLHKEYFLALYAPNVGRQSEFRAAADESLEAQAAIEAKDSKSGVSFEQYLAEYSAG